MRTAASLLLALTFACASSAGSGASDVTLRADADADGSTTLTLHNNSSETVGYNLCTSVLQERTSQGWEVVPEDRACTMELRTLQPGAQADQSIELPAEADGQVRFSTTVELMDSGERVTVVSNPLTVE